MIRDKADLPSVDPEPATRLLVTNTNLTKVPGLLARLRETQHHVKALYAATATNLPTEMDSNVDEVIRGGQETLCVAAIAMLIWGKGKNASQADRAAMKAKSYEYFNHIGTCPPLPWIELLAEA